MAGDFRGALLVIGCEAMFLKSVVFKLEQVSEPAGGLVKTDFCAPAPPCRVSDSIVLRWDLRIGLSDRFLCDAATAGAGPTLESR